MFTECLPTHNYTLSLHDALPISLTTTFPGGEIASMIEKPAAAFIFFGLFLLVKNLVNIKISSAVLTALLILDRKSTRLNSSHVAISYAVFCLKIKINV